MIASRLKEGLDEVAEAEVDAVDKEVVQVAARGVMRDVEDVERDVLEVVEVVAEVGEDAVEEDDTIGAERGAADTEGSGAWGNTGWESRCRLVVVLVLVRAELTEDEADGKESRTTVSLISMSPRSGLRSSLLDTVEGLTG